MTARGVAPGNERPMPVSPKDMALRTLRLYPDRVAPLGLVIPL